MKNKSLKLLKILEELILKYRIAIILSTIILIGAFLRLDDFSQLARFNQDQVRDAQIVDAMAEGESFPLLGPKAGGTTFKLGPAFYYLQYLSGAVFGFDPAGIALFVPILSVASIGFLFLLLRNIFSVNISFALSLLYAVSFYVIKYSRFAWNPNVVPFFILSFLLLLIPIVDKRAKTYHHILLGIIVGIGVQLHTTLLILMPLAIILAYTYVFCKDSGLKIKTSPKKLNKTSIKFGQIHITPTLKSLLICLLVIFVLNVPFFINDLQNEGKNMKAFLNGATTKTEKSIPLYKKLSLDTQFFAQGSAYILTGHEPQKNWFNPMKLLRSKSPLEIFSAILGISVLLGGAFLMAKKIAKEKDRHKKTFLFIIASFSVLSFLLFLPLGEELNIRFFIILVFLPFVFLGLIIEYLLNIRKFGKTFAMILSAIMLVFVSLNARAYIKTYDLDNYTAPESAYGGISMGEAKKLADFITTKSNELQKDAYYEKFEFSRSVAYFTRKNGIKFSAYSEKNGLPENGMLFLISNKESSDDILNSKDRKYELIESSVTGRFNVAALVAKEVAECRIGFITDIHSRKSKYTRIGIRQESIDVIGDFLEQMKNFKPDVIIDGGDFINGSDKNESEAAKTFSSARNLFLSSRTPFLQVIGNHEPRQIPRDTWKKLTGQENTYYSYHCKDTDIIILDATDPEAWENRTAKQGSDYFISSSQFDWLDSHLKNSAAVNVLTFIHVPLIKRSEIGGNVALERDIYKDNVEKLFAILTKYNVDAVFSGHVEALRRYTKNNIAFYTLPGPLKNPSGGVAWYDAFYKISSSKRISLEMSYKKDPAEKNYRVLQIPSEEFDKIEK